MIKLKYGNTNTFFIQEGSGLVVDTDYAGTLPPFYKAIKQNNIRVKDIGYVLATHYHPDHMGIVGELVRQGVKLLLIDAQRDFVHFSDAIFERDGLPYVPIDETRATVISCGESRAFLSIIGIHGEIIHTPSHSEDSVSLALDDGDCFVGDLDPIEYIGAYQDNRALKSDWEHILSLNPKRIFYAHRPEKIMEYKSTAYLSR
ncbi:MAG: MBL fold metallo-hydrolase [Oscillospiraceae bacterium]|nr:MBL fold metallo-hydrolase [Oscillospiraceae bacterium]MBQ2157058.1 MBL fold metallo-hydrolase [Oscillospiraceae bacterium]MBQ2329225.1 MBL fold metallo-hydrolase [Oscillospiraceae bacterium]MBQ3951454.1 MBL fold metallo-hydrolase [Oscillospiraceae bacterium]